MRKDGAKSFEIGTAIGGCVLDQALELERRVRQCGVLEEQPWGQRRRLDICFRMQRYPGWIEIEIYDARENARFMPLAILVTGRHEGELSRHVPQPRSRQSLDERLAIASHTLVTYGKKMERGVKAELQLFTPRGLDDLGGHAVPRHGAARHAIAGIDLHAMIDPVGHGGVEQPVCIGVLAVALVGVEGTMRRHIYARRV